MGMYGLAYSLYHPKGLFQTNICNISMFHCTISSIYRLHIGFLLAESQTCAYLHQTSPPEMSESKTMILNICETYLSSKLWTYLVRGDLRDSNMKVHVSFAPDWFLFLVSTRKSPCY